jgi:hypothetical protein
MMMKHYEEMKHDLGLDETEDDEIPIKRKYFID